MTFARRLNLEDILRSDQEVQLIRSIMDLQLCLAIPSNPNFQLRSDMYVPAIPSHLLSRNPIRSQLLVMWKYGNNVLANLVASDQIPSNLNRYYLHLIRITNNSIYGGQIRFRLGVKPCLFLTLDVYRGHKW